MFAPDALETAEVSYRPSRRSAFTFTAVGTVVSAISLAFIGNCLQMILSHPNRSLLLPAILYLTFYGSFLVLGLLFLRAPRRLRLTVGKDFVEMVSFYTTRRLQMQQIAGRRRRFGAIKQTFTLVSTDSGVRSITVLKSAGLDFDERFAMWLKKVPELGVSEDNGSLPVSVRSSRI